MKRKLSHEDGEDVSTSGDDGEENKPENATRTSKKMKSADHDFSTQEISRLKETEALFHSSLFRLQVSELLKEISVKVKLKARMEEATDTLSNILRNLPEGKEHKITDRKWLDTKAIKIPVIENPVVVKGGFNFLPPSDIRLCGCSLLETVIKPDVVVDLLVTMPKDCFQPKDYLNQRYTRKKALYLCAIASRLCKKKRIEELKFSYHLGNPHRPVLFVVMKGKDSKNIKMCLHAVPESGTFKLSRFHVAKNNIRPKWFCGKETETSKETEDDDVSLPPTPFYNSSILHDLCVEINDQLIEKMLKGPEGLRHGVMLLKVWLRQRGVLEGLGAFSDYLLTSYVVNLLILKKLNRQMNSYQIFRTTLLYLSQADWIQEPPSLFEGKPDKKLPSVDEFRATGSCVFIDRSGYFNLAYMLSPSVFARVKEESKLSLAALDQQHLNCFDALFMTPVAFSRKYDNIFHITVTPEVLQTVAKHVTGLSEKAMDLGGHLSYILSQHLSLLLSKALDKRIKLLQPQLLQVPIWDTSDEPFSYDTVKFLTFGVVLDTSSAFSILDKGPLADSPEAREFSEFWGEKSEMRRFKDGTIHEAVLWTNSPNQSDRRLICKKIIQHVLKMHCGIPKQCIHYMAGRLDPLLHLAASFKNSEQSYGTGEEQSLTVHHAFDQVNRAIRALATLPLGIHSVQGIHPIFRHAEVFPSLPIQKESVDAAVISGHVVPKEGKALPHYAPALEVICMLEGSGKWPEEMEAIQWMKTLFHIKMGKELQEKYHFSVSIHKSYVDVVKDGYVFRLKISNTRELAVMRTVTTESGMVKFKDTEEANALEKEIVALPRLTHLLHSIQQKHPAHSGTVRLCKRWLAAQMIWSLIREEVVELIVAYIFISPHPYSSPGSPIVGLMRFLHLLSTFNWKTDVLMVNLNKDFSEEDFSLIPKDFTKNRATLPCMCIATPQDKQGTQWTKPIPTEPFLQRLIILAKESLKILENQVMSSFASADFKQIFRPPLEHYDIVIQLLKKANTLHHQSVDGKSEISVGQPEAEKFEKLPVPVTNFNAVRRFFHDLQTTFGDVAMFFHDPLGGSVIGMVWKKQTSEKKDFKPSHFTYCKPAIDENEVVSLELQMEQILDDIRVMGGGIVESITDQRKAN